MTFRMRMAAAAAALTIALGAAPATAQLSPGKTYSNLFVFGDSLVDSGNAQIFQARAGQPDSAPASGGYVGGRFSNGNNFADYLSQGAFGTSATPFLANGTNFAVGGATYRARVGTEASPSFAEQIGYYLGSGKTITSDSLILITFGGNDLRTILANPAAALNPATSVSTSITALSDGLEALYNQGGRNFVVVGVPDLGQIPEVTGNGAVPPNQSARTLSQSFNTQAQSATTSFGTTFSANTAFYSLLDLQTKFNADPQAYGLPSNLNTTNQCIGTAAAPTCNGYVYFDNKHPTTQVHQVIARDLALAIGVSAIPEPASWALMIVGIGATGATLRRRRPSLRAAA